MKGPSVQGARRLTSGGVLEQYGEHGEQAQRSNGGPIVCFARQAVRNVGRPTPWRRRHALATIRSTATRSSDILGALKSFDHPGV